MKYLPDLLPKKSGPARFLAIIAIILSGMAAGMADHFIIMGAIILSAALFFILKDPARGIYLAAFALPFERIGTAEVGGLVIRPAQIMILMAILAWLIKKPRINIKEHPLVIPLLIFASANILSIINTPNLERSIAVLCFTFFTLFLSILIPNLITSFKQVKSIILFLIAGCLFVSCFGIYQFAADMAGLPISATGLHPKYTKEILGFTRVQSTALEPLYFGNYLLIPLILSLVLLVAEKLSRRYKILFASCFMIGLANMALTVSRGAYIAFAAALLGIAVIYHKKIFTFKRAAVAVPAIVLAMILLTPAASASTIVQKFIAHSTSLFSGPAWTERIASFETAAKGIKDHPLIGNGIGSYGPLAATFPYFPDPEGWRIVNNEYLELWFETGIFGLCAFLLIVFILFYKAARAPRDPVLNAFALSLLAILIQYNTFSILYITHVWFVIGIIAAMGNILTGSHELEYN